MCLRQLFAYAKLRGMTNPSRTYLLLEERLGEPLAGYVEASRAGGLSWNAIARDLHERTKVGVTSETLRIWFFDSAKASA